MATVFRDVEGSLLVNCMPHKTTVTGDGAVLHDLKVVISEGRIGKVMWMSCIFTAMLLLYTNDEKQSLL